MFNNGFSREELACKCNCGFDTVDVETLFVIEELKRWFNTTVTVSSGCRCFAYNIHVGGVDGSKHVEGRAVDVIVSGVDSYDVYDYLDKLYPGKYGIGKYSTFTHFDTRSNMARW